jgi:hypothetical protein
MNKHAVGWKAGDVKTQTQVYFMDNLIMLLTLYNKKEKCGVISIKF